MAMGALNTPWKSCKVFWCISTDSKMLSRQIIYALFSSPQTHIGAPFMDPAGDGRPKPLNLPTPEKNPVGAYAFIVMSLAR